MRNPITSTKVAIATVIALVAQMILPIATPSAHAAYAFSSTNDNNRANNWPHVNLVRTGLGELELSFINDTNSLAFFEYRIDGATVGTNPHPIVIGDVIHPGVSVESSNIPTPVIVNREFTAVDRVEIRLALGGERDWDFDWTPFEVLSSDDSKFLGSDRYIRANSTADMASQVQVPAVAEDVQFTFSGSAEVIFPGYEHIQAGQWPKPNGDQQWRVNPSLAPGAWTVRAQYLVAGEWIEVTQPAPMVYAIDAPTASYVLPNVDSNIFRGTDNPVRLKVEDQFNQFREMRVTINSVNYMVYRADCDLRQEGNYLLCDVEEASNWSGLAEGTYTATTTTWTKANNRVDNLVSLPFTIDSTKPAITDFAAPALTASPVEVSATATDDTAVESINFYVVEPRPSDGVCTGNGTKLAEFRATTPAIDGRYYAILDLSGLNGDYCVVAVARDTAFNNSALSVRDMVIDTDGPSVPSITNPIDGQYFTGTPILNQWTASTDPSGIEKYQVEYIYDDGHTFAGGPYRDVPGTQTWRNHVPSVGEQGGVTIRVRAIDTLGNVGGWSAPVHYTYDETAPAAPMLASPANNAVVHGGTVTQSWFASTSTDVNHYIYESYHDAAATSLRWSQTVYGTSKTATNVPDATYWWRVKAVDHAGNESTWSPLWKLTIDSTAPDTMITAPADGDTIGGTVTITGTIVDDNILRYYFFVEDSSGNKVVGPFTVYGSTDLSHAWDTTAVADGMYKIQLEARDQANNKDAGSTHSIMVEVRNVVDAVTILTPANGDMYNASPIFTEWTESVTPHGIDYYEVEYVYDDGSGMVTVYRTTPNTWRNQTLSGAVQGDFTIRVRAIDNLGNVSAWSDAVTYTFDSIAPAAPTNGQPHDTFENSDTVTFTWDGVTDSSEPVTYDFQLSQTPLPHIPAMVDPTGTRFTGLTSPEATVTGLADGVWYWHVRAVDAAGNKGPWSDVWFFTVDTTAPVAVLSAPANGSTVSGLVTITGTVTEENPATYTVTVFSGTTVVFTDTLPGTDVSIVWDSASVADGEYAVVLTATDEAGNVSGLSTSTITVNNTVPASEPTPTPAPASEATPTPAALAAPAGTPAGGTGGPVPGQDIDLTDDEAAADSEEVTLAAQSTPGASDDEDGEVAGVTDEATSRSWLWWLLLIPAALIFWFIMKRRNEEQA